MSKTYIKLSSEWIEIFQQLHQETVGLRHEVLLEMALDYADEAVPGTAEQYEYDSALHFFQAIYVIWKRDQSVTRIKIKHIDKLAKSMMEMVDEMKGNYVS